MKNPDEKVNMGAFHDAKKQAFERERKGSFGKGSFRRERNARGARGRREENACQETIVFLVFNIYLARSRHRDGDESEKSFKNKKTCGGWSAHFQSFTLKCAFMRYSGLKVVYATTLKITCFPTSTKLPCKMVKSGFIRKQKQSAHRRCYLTINIPRARMGSESIAHEAEGRMGY